jgi:lipoic acid synthetase
MADYKRSLNVLLAAKTINPDIITKSGLMLGLGETVSEIISVFRDLRKTGCELLSIGQYLAPSNSHYPVAEFIPPTKFDEYRQMAISEGFRGVTAAPLVRSSFKANELFSQAVQHPE